MHVVLPARGEFGLKLRYHVPRVHAMEGTKVVFCEVGEEALYPSADEVVTVRSVPDENRRGVNARGDAALRDSFTALARERYPGASVMATGKGWPEARFVPSPIVRVGFGADVIVCPRVRAYGAEKNWPGWASLVDRLRAGGASVVAAGAPGTSSPVTCPAAWEHERFLDASIEAMLGARVVVATDAGLAHLAVLCGTPLLIVTHRGLVAPGPVVDGDGTVLEPAYWPVRFEEYYAKANHVGSPIEMIDGWNHVDRVARTALRMAGLPNGQRQR